MATSIEPETPLPSDESSRWILGGVPSLRRKLIQLIVVFILAAGAFFIPSPSLDEARRWMLFIFILAAGLWITEVIEPYATAILAVALQVLILGRVDGVLGLKEGGYMVFIQPIASPVIVLFFGGFILAAAARRHHLDNYLAAWFLKPFGVHPAGVLWGIIVITAVFSMWMSNTATAAMMLAVVTPLCAALGKEHPFRKAAVLAVAFAANIGGMGTIIGSPPNGIAVMNLARQGVEISFLEWMLIAMPLVILLLGILWWLLLREYPIKETRVEVPVVEMARIKWEAMVVCGTFFLCAFLWMTESLHGLPAAVVALVPVVVFTFLAVITPSDLARLDWHVLILVAGGMSLGEALRITGLSTWFLQAIPFADWPIIWVVCCFGVITLMISNFMSNSAAAALLIPLAVSFSDKMPVVASMMVAFAASLAMSLPVSTPPNALVYATGGITTHEMARTGTKMSVIGYVWVVVVLIGVNSLGFFR